MKAIGIFSVQKPIRQQGSLFMIRLSPINLALHNSTVPAAISRNYKP